MREPRPSVLAMRPYSPPTGNRANMLRLDFNERTTPLPPQLLAAIRAAITDDSLSMYPDYDAALPAAARLLGRPAESIVLTNGTDEAIQLLVATYLSPGDRLVIIEPSYAMYRFYAEAAGVEVDAVQCSVDDDLAIPVDEIIRRLPGAAALFIANPNNPTGAALSLDTLTRIAEAAGDTLVLVDEAYVEFHGVTALPLLDRFDNVVVSRTFSKAYGLAGLRCGCLAAAEPVTRWLRTAQSPYSVNAVAAAALAAVAALQPAEEIDRHVREVIDARTHTAAALERLGFRVFPSAANFLLFHAGERADRILRHLAGNGILIRDRRHDLDGCLRVSIGSPEQMQQFVTEMERCT